MVMRRHNRRPDGRRVKSLRSYSIDEIARLLGVHRNTVRHWIRNGLPALDDRRPRLILGRELKAFLTRQRNARRQSCQPGQIFCVKCREPREPFGKEVDYVPSSPTAGALVGQCPVCGTLIYRRSSLARLPVVKGALDVQTKRPKARIVDTTDPCVDCDLKLEA
jgi:excisionase family DNA binding protein